MATSPDSVTYSTQNYGLLGPLPAYVVNLQDVPSVDPTGNDDSTLAINAALASLPDAGGALIIPPGLYKFSDSLLVKSNTQVRMYGATLKAASTADWVGTYGYGFTNVNNTADVITDSNITIEGGTIDYADFTTIPDGSRHLIFFRKCRTIRVLNMRLLNGGDSVALKSNDDTLIDGCYAEAFKNCAWDHWDGPTNARVSNSYALATSYTTAQIMNFNPDTDAPILTGVIADGLTVTNCIFESTNATATPIQIEPLRNSSTKVRNVSVVGCVFKNVAMNMRGDIANALVANCTFSDTLGGGSVFNCYTNVGGSPVNVWFTNNTINNPTTSSGFGVIRHEGATGGVVGNGIYGWSTGSSSDSAIYTTDVGLVLYGNQTSWGVISARGTLGTGGASLANGTTLGFFDSAGSRLKIKTVTDTLGLYSTDGSGGERLIWSIVGRNGLTDYKLWTHVAVDGYVRLLPNAGITATGTTGGTGYQITHANTEFTTVAAGTGCRLPAAASEPVSGGRFVIWNAGANTLKVYPMSGGQINALGTDVADTIAAGSCKTYVAISATLYRIET